MSTHYYNKNTFVCLHCTGTVFEPAIIHISRASEQVVENGLEIRYMHNLCVFTMLWSIIKIDNFKDKKSWQHWYQSTK